MRRENAKRGVGRVGRGGGTNAERHGCLTEEAIMNQIRWNRNRFSSPGRKPNTPPGGVGDRGEEGGP